ncbi:MAG: hypothetical protein A2V70_14415 [Planctomycetes bacterium RBG_13_63_9]|nr:MAG: hypothetical protein A2V70_14415 [Planctomycetes bacterium RBG_13_63_9]
MLCLHNRIRVLAVGAHPDDIEIGAGGFIFRVVREQSAEVRFLILTAGLQHLGPRRTYRRTTRVSEAEAAARHLGIGAKNVEVLGYRDCRLHQCKHELIRELERRLFDAKGRPRFDVILTHARGDTHEDHVQIHEATISAARNFDGTVLFYEAPSTMPDQFRPTFFVNLDDEAVAHKQRALAAHKSQQDKSYMSQTRTEGIARSWAWFYRIPESLLEAFEVGRFFWNSVPTGTKKRLSMKQVRKRGFGDNP